MKITRQQLLEDMFRAYYDARKHKRNTINQLRFEIDLEQNIIALTDQVWSCVYKPSQSVCFIVEHPVKREIFAADFRDRVIHHLLFNYINPWFERQFIADCYSCRKGRGTLYGIERIEHHIRSCTDNFKKQAYVLKLDISGYFMSIDKNILFSKIEKTIARRLNTQERAGADVEMVMYLIREVIFDDPTKNCHFKTAPQTWHGLPRSKSLFNNPPERGLPIGNLTSQLFSNIYLAEFDNYVKRNIGAKHYGRYVDDFFIIHLDKQALIRYVQIIDQYLTRELKLKIHPNKIYLQRICHGVGFLGAAIRPFRRHLVVRTKRTVNRAFRDIDAAMKEPKAISVTKLKKTRSTLNSYLGYMKHFNCHRLKQRIESNSPNLQLYGRFSYQYRKYNLLTKPPESITGLSTS